MKNLKKNHRLRLSTAVDSSRQPDLSFSHCFDYTSRYLQIAISRTNHNVMDYSKPAINCYSDDFTHIHFVVNDVIIFISLRIILFLYSTQLCVLMYCVKNTIKCLYQGHSISIKSQILHLKTSNVIRHSILQTVASNFTLCHFVSAMLLRQARRLFYI